jgi:predicted Zn-dependent protease
MRRSLAASLLGLALALPAAADDSYLQPNVRDADGTPGWVHLDPIQMPLRIAIRRPRVPAMGEGTRGTREAAIRGFRLWEEALRGRAPWFVLEFVEKDDEADVQVVWRENRSAGGDAAGRARFGWRREQGWVRIQGEVVLAVQPNYPAKRRLRRDEVERLTAHEFGHVLGLGHCLDCESAMNYSWQAREREFVSPLDVETFLALMEKPNATRVDGRPLQAEGSGP